MDSKYQKLLNDNWQSLIVLLQNSQDVFWITSSDYQKQIYVNPAFEQIWGFPAADLYANPLFWLDTLIAEDKFELAARSRLPHSAIMNPYVESYRIRRADNEIRIIRDYTYPIYNKIGQCIAYAGIAQDITLTSKLERNLELSTHYLPILIEHMTKTAFCVRDLSLKKVLYLSQGVKNILNNQDEMNADSECDWQDQIVPEDKQLYEEMRISLLQLKENRQQSLVYRIKRSTGEIRWIKETSFPIINSEHGQFNSFASIFEDITQEKHYEIELKQAKEKAEAASIGISNFIAGMSHDFRTPLNGLLGMAEILRSGRCYPEQKEYVDAILQAGNSLLDLVEDIINFVALDLNKLPVKEQWFNLDKVIKEVLLSISPQALEKKVEIILSYPESAPKEVYGDVNRMRRILMNLANNAVKFTNKGHVLISIELFKEAKNKQWLRFIVEDTGIGISKENFEYIFGSFNRIDPSYRGRYKGTGLGLTIVKQFVKDLGGKIKVISQLNQGSVFYCTIPFKIVPKPLLAENADHYTLVNTLLVDDHAKRASVFLKQFGFKNATIINSHTLQNLVKDNSQELNSYQLILVDDQIKTDVLTLARKIREKTSGFLILLADKDSNRTLQKIKKAGFDDSITKPLQPLVIIKILENAAASIGSVDRAKKLKQMPIDVLLVEDDLLTQKITRWMLEELNCNVKIAGTGKTALELLDEPYHLIVMDVGLPDMDGITLAERIRADYPAHDSTPIVALTAHVLDMDKEKCLAAGMNDFLKKPLFKKDLKRLFSRIF